MCLIPPPAFGLATMDTAAFDPTQGYCTHDKVFFWQPPPLAFRDGRLPVSRSKAFFIPTANSFPLRRRAASSRTTKLYNTSCACPVLACTSNMDDNLVTSMSPCGNASEKISCLLALMLSSPKLQSSHLLDTGDRLLAEARPYDLIWVIGYRADDGSARQPPLSRGLNLLGNTLQTVRHLFRDRAPPPTRHQRLSPQSISPSSRDCIFEVHPSTRQRLSPEDTSAAAYSSG